MNKQQIINELANRQAGTFAYLNIERLLTLKDKSQVIKVSSCKVHIKPRYRGNSAWLGAASFTENFKACAVDRLFRQHKSNGTKYFAFIPSKVKTSYQTLSGVPVEPETSLFYAKDKPSQNKPEFQIVKLDNLVSIS